MMRHTLGSLRSTIAFRPAADRLKIGLAAFVAGSSFICACAGRKSVEVPATSPSAAASPVEQQPQVLSPKQDEVEAAVRRVFKDAAVLDSSRKPNFLTGDFNGDRSQDVAVILKPAPGKLSDLNQESPPWILADPFLSTGSGMSSLRVSAGDLLLAVIHGYGPSGWRDPQATQTYLLKNAVGSDAKTFSKSDVAAASQGGKLPRLLGDSIGEALRGRSGYLYFAGATYSWYDPKTFKGEAESRMVHPGTTVARQSNLLDLREKRGVRLEK